MQRLAQTALVHSVSIRGSILLVCLGVLAGAQATTPAKNRACEKAARIVAKGHPSTKEAGAFLTLNACGSIGATALAVGMQTYTTETDTAALEVFMSQVDNWRDSTLMESALSLSNNPAATPQARVYAVRYLLILTHPYMRYSYGGLTTPDSTVRTPDFDEVTTIGCRSALGSEAPDRVGTPLPADYTTLIRSVLASLAASTSTPAAVRNAARCGSTRE